MANETNWSANLDRKERERAKIALKEHKATLPEQKMVRVDDKTTLIFTAAMSEAEIQKRVKRYHKYMKER